MCKVANITIDSTKSNAKHNGAPEYNLIIIEWRSASGSENDRRQKIEKQLQTNRYMVPGVTLM